MDESLIQIVGNSQICFSGKTRAERFQHMADIMNEISAKLDDYIWFTQESVLLT